MQRVDGAKPSRGTTIYNKILGIRTSDENLNFNKNMDITYDETTDEGYIQLEYPKGIKSIPSKDETFIFHYNSESDLIGIEFKSLQELVRILESNVELEY